MASTLTAAATTVQDADQPTSTFLEDPATDPLHWILPAPQAFDSIVFAQQLMIRMGFALITKT